jgi:excisionase family DNA binding protein
MAAHGSAGKRTPRGVAAGDALRPAALQLLTVREAATVLALNAGTVWRMVWDGSLPSVRLRRSVRVRASALADLLERSEHPACRKRASTVTSMEPGA